MDRTYLNMQRIVLELKALMMRDYALVGWPEGALDKPQYYEVDQWQLLPAEEGMTAEDALAMPDKRWREYGAGMAWGGWDAEAFFRFRVAPPRDFFGKRLYVRLSTGREGWDAVNPQFLAYVNGVVRQGMDVNHRELLLSTCAREGEEFDVLLWAHGGMLDQKTFLRAAVTGREEELEKLYYHMSVPLEAARVLPDSAERRTILEWLQKAANLLDLREPYSPAFYDSVRRAGEMMDKFYRRGFGGEGTLSVIGESHLDVAWLWREKHTRAKAARIAATALELMRYDRNFQFVFTQPYLYESLAEEYPRLFERIRERSREKRWETEGAMWVEADCNITGGESLVRQLLYGKAYLQKYFDVDSRILWLPDTFGFTAALPQIMKKSGVDYLLTAKLTRNDTNRWPYDSFRWRGIDGSEVLVSTAMAIDCEELERGRFDTKVNGRLTPAETLGAWRRYQQKDCSDTALFTYGFGDGGGGPIREDLENLGRMQAGIPGLPRIKTQTAGEYFDQLAKSDQEKPLPKYDGELYFEYHRGTYTTFGAAKRLNRRCEFLLQEAESYSALAEPLGLAYPQEELRSAWKKLLAQQFHDTLPGTCIKEACEDAMAALHSVEEKGEAILDAALTRIADHMEGEFEKGIVIFNPAPFLRSDVVRIPFDGFDDPKFQKGFDLLDEKGNRFEGQRMELDDGDEVWVYVEDLPPKGYKAFEVVPPIVLNLSRYARHQEYAHFTNDFFEVAMNESGEITRLYDKIYERDVIPEGARGNEMRVYEDKPAAYDAWNISRREEERSWPVDQVEKVQVENGPVCRRVRFTKRLQKSIVIQDVIFYHRIPRIDFETLVDWQADQMMLKTAFPVEVNARSAHYDIQFGSFERPTHNNTSYERAQFEVVGHKWADLSETDYGVSLLSDSKYGYEVKEGIMRMTLLRSPRSPNPEMDRHVHHFIYSLYPHEGNYAAGGTVPMGYFLNQPLRVRPITGRGLAPTKSALVRASSEHVVVETFKAAETGDGYIVRMYECHNTRGTVSLTFARPVEKAYECDLLERYVAAVSAEGCRVAFEVQPFEIKTLFVRFNDAMEG